MPGVGQYGVLAAIDTRTNKIAWQQRTTYAQCAGSGATATAGGLMLHNEPDGKFQVFNAKTGALLWQFETGETGVAGANGAVGGPIAVYEANGQQHIAFVMNHHVWAFRLGGTIPQRTPPPPLPVVDDWDGRIEDVTTITLGTETVNNIRNANREEAWSNPWAIAPARVRVKAGTAITFTNTTKVAHTIKARDGSWTSGSIAPGAIGIGDDREAWHVRVRVRRSPLVDRTAHRPMMRLAAALFTLSLAWAVPQAASRQTADQPRQAASGPASCPLARPSISTASAATTPGSRAEVWRSTHSIRRRLARALRPGRRSFASCRRA